MKQGNRKTLNRVLAIFDGTINVMAFLAAVILLYVTSSIVLGVVMRYFLGRPLIWTIQLGEYSMLYITLFAAPWLLRDEGHVTMDLIMAGLKPEHQKTLKKYTSLLGSALCFALFVYGTRVTWDTWQRGLFPSEAVLAIPNVYVIFIIPLSSLMLSIGFIRIFCRTRGELQTSSELKKAGDH